MTRATESGSTARRWRRIASAAAIVVVAFGAVGLLAWAIDSPRLQAVLAGGATMKVNTALCLVCAGLALLLLSRTARAARVATALLAGTVLVVGGLTAMAYLTGVDAGIDQWLARAPAPLFPDLGEPAESPPGRMALATALAFTLAALALLASLAARQRVRFADAARAAAYGVLAIGTICVVGYLLDVDFLYSWYAFGSVAVHTSAGLCVLGVGLLAAGRAGAWATRPSSADARIAHLAAWMVLLAAGTTGVASFAALQSQVRQALAEGLQFARAERVGQLDTTVETRSVRAALVAADPRLLAHLRAGQGTALAAVMDGFLSYGFSALVVTLPDGGVIASGDPLPAAEAGRGMATEIGDGRELIWQGDFYLRRQFTLRDGAGVLGTLRAEQRLANLTGALLSAASGWTTADFVLCRPQADAFHCFPTRLHPMPLTLPLESPDHPLLVQVAWRDGPGFHSGFDYRGRRVLGAAGPIPSLGLIAMLKVDAQEIYRPIGRQFLIAMTLVSLLAVAGAMLLRWWLQPMASALKEQVRERTIELESANARLRHTEARFRALIDASAQIVWTTGADGTPEDTVSWRIYTGQTYEEWRDGGWIDAVHPDDRAGIAAVWEGALRSGEGFAHDYRVRRHDGAWRWTSCRAVPVPAPDGGREGWVGMNIDIDERRKAEEALRRAHEELEQRVVRRTRELVQANTAAEQLAAIVESSDDAIYSQDLAGHITSWNAGAERLYGYRAEEVLGCDLSVLGVVPSAQTVDLPAGAPPARQDAVQRRRDGTPIDVSLTISPLRNADGALTGVATIARDVSLARRQERQVVAALKEKEALLQEVHHRVKNNLQVMASLLNLQRHVTDAPAVRLAMEEAADRITSIALLHDKLYRAGDLGRIDVAAYLRDLAERLLYQHDRADGRVRLEVEPATVHLGIDQAIPCGLIANELVTNALKYAFPDRADGTIRVAVRRDERGRIHLVIADDGVGLPASVEPGGTTTLGLQLVGTFVEQLDGTLALDRRHGTRFDVSFPATS